MLSHLLGWRSRRIRNKGKRHYKGKGPLLEHFSNLWVCSNLDSDQKTEVFSNREKHEQNLLCLKWQLRVAKQPLLGGVQDGSAFQAGIHWCHQAESEWWGGHTSWQEAVGNSLTWSRWQG